MRIDLSPCQRFVWQTYSTDYRSRRGSICRLVCLDRMALHRNSLYFLSDRSHLYALPVTAAYPISSIEQFRDRLSSKIMLYLIPIVSIPIFLLAAVGFFVTWRRKRKQLILIYLIIALTILQNIAFYGSPRYRAPIEPLLILFVGGMLWWLLGAEDTSGTWRYFRSRKARVQEVTEHISSAAKSDEEGEKISSPAIHSAE